MGNALDISIIQRTCLFVSVSQDGLGDIVICRTTAHVHWIHSVLTLLLTIVRSVFVRPIYSVLDVYSPMPSVIQTINQNVKTVVDVFRMMIILSRMNYSHASVEQVILAIDVKQSTRN